MLDTTCFHIVFILFLYVFVSSGLTIQSQPQPLQQSQLQRGVKNREKAPPPKDYQKRKQNVRKKDQKLLRVGGEHFFGLWGTLSGS